MEAADSWLEEKSTHPLTWQVVVCRIKWMSILVGQFKASIYSNHRTSVRGCSRFPCCGGKGCEQTEKLLGSASASRRRLQGRDKHKVFAVSSVNLCREQTQGRSNSSRQGQLQGAETGHIPGESPTVSHCPEDPSSGATTSAAAPPREESCLSLAAWHTATRLKASVPQCHREVVSTAGRGKGFAACPSPPG